MIRFLYMTSPAFFNFWTLKTGLTRHLDPVHPSLVHRHLDLPVPVFLDFGPWTFVKGDAADHSGPGTRSRPANRCLDFGF